MTLIALLVVMNQAGTFSDAPLVPAFGEELANPAPPRRPLPAPPVEQQPPADDAADSDMPSMAEHRAAFVRAEVERPTRHIYELAIPGAVAALSGWIAGWATFFGSIHCSGFLDLNCTSASALLLFPQVGPWLAIAAGGTSDPWFGTNLALGLVQLAGFAAMVTGFAARVPVGDDAVTLNVVPTGKGVAIGGAF
jgi:hypothetical protein